MKATGIVRRIDDLGRVVIPKEIRRTMRIREGDPLEIYTSGSGEVIFKKYSPVGEMHSFAHSAVSSAAKQSEFSFAVCDRDHCIAAAGSGSRDLIGAEVGEVLEEVMLSRKSREFENDTKAFEKAEMRLRFAVPIIAAGDISGVVLVLGDAENFDESERKLALFCASFLGGELEM